MPAICLLKMSPSLFFPLTFWGYISSPGRKREVRTNLDWHGFLEAAPFLPMFMSPKLHQTTQKLSSRNMEGIRLAWQMPVKRQPDLGHTRNCLQNSPQYLEKEVHPSALSFLGRSGLLCPRHTEDSPLLGPERKSDLLSHRQNHLILVLSSCRLYS